MKYHDGSGKGMRKQGAPTGKAAPVRKTVTGTMACRKDPVAKMNVPKRVSGSMKRAK